MTPQYFHTAPTSCAILPTIVHTTKLTYVHISLFTPTKSMDNYTPTRHSALLTPQPSVYKATRM